MISERHEARESSLELFHCCGTYLRTGVPSMKHGVRVCQRELKYRWSVASGTWKVSTAEINELV